MLGHDRGEPCGRQVALQSQASSSAPATDCDQAADPIKCGLLGFPGIEPRPCSVERHILPRAGEFWIVVEERDQPWPLRAEKFSQNFGVSARTPEYDRVDH